jgi:hypothetical protein
MYPTAFVSGSLQALFANTACIRWYSASFIPKAHEGTQQFRNLLRSVLPVGMEHDHDFRVLLERVGKQRFHGASVSFVGRVRQRYQAGISHTQTRQGSLSVVRTAGFSLAPAPVF